jgi:disulfide bond formation protein DsbB
VTLDRKTLIRLAAGGSLALLLAAWAFEYLGGLAPCPLCYWQRWPHIAAVVIGVLALGPALRALPLLGAAAALTTAGIGIYHTGVERGWWEGPAACSGTGLGGLSGADLLSTEAGPALVLCDEVAWSFAGLSMASWNALASLALAALWLAAAARTRPA